MLDFDKYDALTFDCYGTLIDWETGIVDALTPVLRAHGIDGMNSDDLLSLYAEFEVAGKSGEYRKYRHVLHATVDGICQRLGFAPTPQERSCLTDSIGTWRPFPDTTHSLQRLKTKYKLCIISNVDDDLFAGTAQQLGVAMDYVVTAEQAGSYKPSHNNFALAVSRIDIPKERILHVAESIKLDIVPAKSFGMDAVWVHRASDANSHSGASGNPVNGASGADLEVPDLKTLAEMMGL